MWPTKPGRSLIGPASVALALALLAWRTPSPAAQEGGKDVRLLFTYGSEKDLWLKEVTRLFHDRKVLTRGGKVIRVDLEPMGSGQCMDALLEGKKKPHLTSPAAGVWINLANATVPRGGKPVGTHIDVKGRLVRSPVVLAVWQGMVKAAGWDTREVGWNHLADLIEELGKDDKGWAARGKKEWGSFKFAHTHPQLSNSGLLGVLAMAHARADSSRPLTAADLRKEDVRGLMTEIQGSVLFYGESTGFLGNALMARGPTKISAAVLYESEVIRINKAAKQPERLVAIYPSEGTYWSDHPVGIVHADWVTPEHEEAAEKYIDFLLADPQQKRALVHGFRPGRGDARTDATLGDPFVAKYGVNPAQPRKVLTAPERGVVEAVLRLWQNEQRGLRVVLAIDVSFSMKSFRKLDQARRAAIELVRGLSDTSRLTLIAFNHEVRVVAEDVRLDAEGKKEIVRHLDALRPRGGTHLYDAVSACFDVLGKPIKGGPPREKKSAMRAVILLSDGLDRGSRVTLAAMHKRLKGGDDVPAFYTIAYGRPGGDQEDPDPPDRPLLAKIASETGGRAYSALPDSIDKVLDDVSSFFGARPRQGKK